MLFILRICVIFPVVKGYGFEGCFTRESELHYSFKQFDNPDNSTIGCMNRCQFRNDKMVATTVNINSFECYCGNDNQLNNRIDDDKCNYPCPVSIGDQCGREQRVAVYTIDGYTGPFNVIPNGMPLLPFSSTLAKNPGSLYQTTEDYETDTSTVNVESDVNSVKNANNGNSTCVCDDAGIGNRYLSSDQTENITQKIEAMRKVLAVDAKSTSKYLNTKRSAPDDRPSAIAIGSVGIVVILVPIFLVLLSDVIKLSTCRTFKKG